MKTSSEVIIFLGFILWVEFVGAVVYRSLINDNSRKQDGGNVNVLNEEKTRNANDFGSQGAKVDEAGARNVAEKEDEEAGVRQLGKDEGGCQGGAEQKGSGVEAGLSENGKKYGLGDGTENVSVLIGDKGLCTCTCGLQGGMGGEDGSGQGTDTETDILDDGIGEDREQGNIDGEAPDKKDRTENEENGSEHHVGSGQEVEDTENTNGGGSAQQVGVDVGEPGLETSTGQIGGHDEMGKDGGYGVYAGEETFKFSPLDR